MRGFGVMLFVGLLLGLTTACGGQGSGLPIDVADGANPGDIPADNPSLTDLPSLTDAPTDLPVAADGSPEVVPVEDGWSQDVGVDVPANCPGEYLCPCTENGDCYSGYCVDTMDGRRCSKPCSTGDNCSQGWQCSPVPGAADPVDLCRAPASLCRPCQADEDCAWSSGGEDLCIPHGDIGSFCGVACDVNEDCIDGFVCADIETEDRATVKQCVPTGNAVCPCTPYFEERAYQTVCRTVNPDLPDRACTALRTCDEPCPAPMPLIEDCNGLDEDCNGLTDDFAVAPPADKDTGVCAGQVKTCTGAGGWIDPVYSDIVGFESTEVTCDGLDNDCDTLTDEDMNNPLADVQYGVCAGATKVCNGAGGGWVEPDYSTMPYYESGESSCDGRDNDCDNLVDADPEVAANAPPANKHVGVCASATKVCVSGAWAEPNYALILKYQSPETSCDNLDNDCNGVTDGGCDDDGDDYCDSFMTAGRPAPAVCPRGGGDCNDVVAAINPGATESCNNKDDDCDGKTDNVKGTTNPITTPTLSGCLTAGVCSSGVPGVCVSGAWQCNYAGVAYFNNPETSCDSKDNDCDGCIDEDLSADSREPNNNVWTGSSVLFGSINDPVTDCNISPDYDVVDYSIHRRASGCGVDVDWYAFPYDDHGECNDNEVAAAFTSNASNRAICIYFDCKYGKLQKFECYNSNMTQVSDGPAFSGDSQGLGCCCYTGNCTAAITSDTLTGGPDCDDGTNDSGTVYVRITGTPKCSSDGRYSFRVWGSGI